jgi:hypothetical protein
MNSKFNGFYCVLLTAAFGVNSTRANAIHPVGAALAEFESGATHTTQCSADAAVGRQKEISRYQILPVVWRQYSNSRNYQDPELAWHVAQKILRERERDFRKATGRQWDSIDLYLMWNAPGHYRRVQWDRKRISPAVLERAERFANLFEARVRQIIQK